MITQIQNISIQGQKYAIHAQQDAQLVLQTRFVLHVTLPTITNYTQTCAISATQMLEITLILGQFLVSLAIQIVKHVLL